MIGNCSGKLLGYEHLALRLLQAPYGCFFGFINFVPSVLRLAFTDIQTCFCFLCSSYKYQGSFVSEEHVYYR